MPHVTKVKPDLVCSKSNATMSKCCAQVWAAFTAHLALPPLISKGVRNTSVCLSYKRWWISSAQEMHSRSDRSPTGERNWGIETFFMKPQMILRSKRWWEVSEGNVRTPQCCLHTDTSSCPVMLWCLFHSSKYKISVFSYFFYFIFYFLKVSTHEAPVSHQRGVH